MRIIAQMKVLDQDKIDEATRLLNAALAEYESERDEVKKTPLSENSVERERTTPGSNLTTPANKRRNSFYP